MEEHEKQILAQNVDELATCTDCSFKFIAKFLLSANISEEEAEELTELKSNKTNQARRFYEIFISGNRDYQRLLTVLRETNQSEALQILTSVKLEDESKLVLTFKEKLTLKDPAENVLESSSLESEVAKLNNLNIDNLSLYGATLLGRGMYDAFVYKHKFNKADRAIKSISNKQLDIEKATSEVEDILKLGNHQNVIKVFLGKELNSQRFIIVMELCIASLLDWIEQKQPFIRPQELLRQATAGLVFLHDNHITHGNLKPTNILLYLDKGNLIQIKLSDFRPKRIRNINRSTTTLFESDTLGWMAPEVIQDFNNHDGRTEITVTSATDVFSLGCLFYFVMTEGKHPFGDRIRRPVNILQSHYVVSLNDVTAVLPLNICIAICMTNRNPMLRPTAKSLLNHHIFWSAEKTLQFISQIVKCCHQKSVSISNCIQRLEASSTYVLGGNSETLNWTNQLSPSLHSSIKEYEQTLTHAINSKSILDLINAIKHFSGLPSKFPHEMGDSADEILGYWTSKRFPFLIPIIWKAFEVMKDDLRLATFYDNFTAGNYEVIDAINLLSNMSTSDKVLNYPGSSENKDNKNPEEKYRQTSSKTSFNNTPCQLNDGSSTESSTLSLLIADDATSKSSKKKRKKLHKVRTRRWQNKHGRSNPTKKLGKTEHKQGDELGNHAKTQEETTVYKAAEESDTQVSSDGEQKETDSDKEISGSFCSEHKVSDSSWSDTNEDLCSDDYENGEKNTDPKYHAVIDDDFDACNESDVNDKPLELIVFQSDAKEDNSCINVQLNQGSLDIVLQSTEDKPLCVISVVGPPRTGKSLLLNYIKLSLEALEDGDKSFDIIANVDKPVCGFAWNANYDPQTKGIWVWSRAFLIDTTGKGVAVILLDTQGFNENTSTPQEISCILGLSILSSSITIYNLENDIPTEVFKSLAPFFQYGSLCKEIDEQCTDDSPFQKLSFLVRDWNNSFKYKHGEEGGKLLLKQKVRSLKGNLKKITLNAFRNCFHQVDSYLMPNIGQNGIQESFSGVTVELDPEFASHLKLYLDNLLGKRNLHAQKVLGKNVTASEFASFMQAFCKFFSVSSKAGDLVNENDLFEVRCQTLHENIVVKSLGKYHRVMNKKLKLTKYTTGKELSDTDKIARNQAFSIFKRASKLEEFNREFEKRLEHRLEKAFEALRCSNSLSRTSYVTECIQNSKEVFKNLLTNKLPFDNHQATIYDDEYIYITTEKAIKTVTEDFLQIFLDEDDKSLQDLQKSLHNVLVSIRESFLQQNSLNRNRANGIFRDISSKIIQEYEDTMNHLLSDFPFVELPILRQSHNMNLKRALATFDNFKKPGDSGIIQQHREELITELEKVYNNLSEKQNGKIGAKMKEGNELVKTHIEGYTKAFKTQVKNCSSLELQEIHAEASLGIMEKFRSINPFPEDTTQHELLNIRLQDQLRLVFDVAKREELDAKKKLQDKLEKAVGKGIELYKNEMEAIKGSSEFLESESLNKAHKACVKTVLTNFDDKKTSKNSELVDEYRKHLVKLMEQKYAEEKEFNDTVVLMLKSEAKNWITDCLKEYQDAFKETVKACELSEDFNQEHEKHKLNTEKSFNSKWSSVYKSRGFRDQFVEELRIEIDKLFKEFKELFESQQRSDIERTTLVKEETRKYYHEEMEKNLKNQKFIQPKVLENLHDRAIQSALSRCVNKTPLKEPQITSIKQALQMSYKKYKDQNTMKLNWELGSQPAIGIDLGTENCRVSVFFRGEIIAVRNAEGKVTTPSYVTFEQNGRYKVGQVAKDAAFQNPENTVYDLKRLIGRNMQDEQFKDDMRCWSFLVVDRKKGPVIEIYGKQYLPEGFVALLLKHPVSEAEKFLGVAIKKAVITVPSYFTDSQRAATVDAGVIAGLEVLQILDEPTAAALAYKLERYYEVSRKVLVFDLGGGTFDVTILDINGSQIKILNKDGDPNLRAEIFDKSLMEYCSSEFKRQHDVDPFQEMYSVIKQEKDAAMRRYRRLLTYCERGKLHLDSSSETVISVDAFYNSTDLNVMITRQIFEEINAVHFKKAVDIVERSLKHVNLSKGDIDDIILVGGSSRIPKVQQMLSEYFEGKEIIHQINPEEVVACGAAVQAALLNGRVLLQDLKLESIEDVTPMSIGIEAIVDGIAGSFSPIIPKNTKIPTTAKMVYKTFKDNQQNAMIKIFQGEAPLAKDNHILAEFTVRGIPPGPAGKESVDINLEIDAMGVFSVSAVVGSTGVKQCLTITETKPRRISRLKIQELLAEVNSLHS